MIIHILKDGTEVDDITVHVVKIGDAPEAYEILDRVRERKERQ